MNPTKIRITIAELCGWTYVNPLGGRTTDPRWDKWKVRNPEESQDSHSLPNFCEDLNAMHEAEKTLSDRSQIWYLQRLSQVRLRDGVGGMIACMLDKLAFATANQRAEAFLRTHNKWPDPTP